MKTAPIRAARRGVVLGLLAAFAALAGPAAPAGAAVVTDTRPFTEGSVLDLVSGVPGTPWGQSTVTYQRAGASLSVGIALRGVEPSTTYDFVVFSTSELAGGPVPTVTTDASGSGDARVVLRTRSSGAIILLVDGPAGVTVTGVTPFAYAGVGAP